MLNILSNITLKLQPFVASQAKIFSEAHLDGLLEASEVKTDEQRMIESSGTAGVSNRCSIPRTTETGLHVFPPLCLSGERIVPAEMKTQEWLLPETTASFNELPLQYNGVCGYTLVKRDGLLLPGTVLMVHQCDIRKAIWMFLLCQIRPQRASNKVGHMEAKVFISVLNGHLNLDGKPAVIASSCLPPAASPVFIHPLVCCLSGSMWWQQAK